MRGEIQVGVDAHGVVFRGGHHVRASPALLSQPCWPSKAVMLSPLGRCMMEMRLSGAFA